jgi:methionine synthase I (cobalamin-dependent)
MPLISQKYTVTVTEEMHKRLEEERKRRFLETIPETIRTILSEYLSAGANY